MPLARFHANRQVTPTTRKFDQRLPKPKQERSTSAGAASATTARYKAVLIASDTLREYFSSRHPKAIGIISSAYFSSQLVFDVLFV